MTENATAVKTKQSELDHVKLISSHGMRQWGIGATPWDLAKLEKFSEKEENKKYTD